MSEKFKAECVALSYLVAMVLTLLFNVSTVTIVSRFQSDSQMRAAFANVAPALSFQIYGTTQQLASNSAPTISGDQLASAYAVFKCVEGRTNFPVGWPWMAPLIDGVVGRSDPEPPAPTQPPQAAAAAAAPTQTPASGANTRATAPTNASTAQIAAAPTACTQAAARLPEGDLKAALANLDVQLATAPAEHAALRSATRTFGPDPLHDNVLWVLIGWLITIVAAAQGAPFWFNIIKRMTGPR